MDRSDQGFHTLAVSSPLSSPSSPLLLIPNFISCPLPLSIYLPLVPTLSSQTRLACTANQWLGLSAISQQDKQWQSVSSRGRHYPFPNPTYNATLDDLPIVNGLLWTAPPIVSFGITLLLPLHWHTFSTWIQYRKMSFSSQIQRGKCKVQLERGWASVTLMLGSWTESLVMALRLLSKWLF